MEKRFILFNPRINNYYTGYNYSFDEAWTLNYKDAKIFESDSEIESIINNTNDDYDTKEIFEGVCFLEVRTIYIK